MFIEQLINTGPTPTLERLLRFTEQRQNLLTDNVANVSTPNYRQRDLSTAAFQRALRQRLADGTDAASTPVATEGGDVDGVLSHDGNNRSMEQLMSEGAKNALMHNTVVELLRRQYQTMDLALREHIG